MTIAELLIHTHVTLEGHGLAALSISVGRMTRDPTAEEEESFHAATARIKAGAKRRARSIVAAYYGEPCRQMHTRVEKPISKGTLAPPRFVSEPSFKGHPGDTCSECGWPRGEHGEEHR